MEIFAKELQEECVREVLALFRELNLVIILLYCEFLREMVGVLGVRIALLNLTNNLLMLIIVY